MAERQAYAGACIELFSRLWGELESIVPLASVRGDKDGSSCVRRLEILRLELVVLQDACRSTRWRMVLDGEQRRGLERLVGEALDALTTGFDEAPLQAIARVQNCLLDAVLEQRLRVENRQPGTARRRAMA